MAKRIVYASPNVVHALTQRYEAEFTVESDGQEVQSVPNPLYGFASVVSDPTLPPGRWRMGDVTGHIPR